MVMFVLVVWQSGDSSYKYVHNFLRRLTYYPLLNVAFIVAVEFYLIIVDSVDTSFNLGSMFCLLRSSTCHVFIEKVLVSLRSFCYCSATIVTRKTCQCCLCRNTVLTCVAQGEFMLCYRVLCFLVTCHTIRF